MSADNMVSGSLHELPTALDTIAKALTACACCQMPRCQLTLSRFELGPAAFVLPCTMLFNLTKSFEYSLHPGHTENELLI